MGLKAMNVCYNSIYIIVQVPESASFAEQQAIILAPRGAWLRQKSCQEISCSRSGGIKEVSFF